MEEIFAYLRDVLGVRYLPQFQSQSTAMPSIPRLPSDESAAPLTKSARVDSSKPIEGCTLCKLHRTRKNIVFGSGPSKADLMFIGEGPGEEEDQQGVPFAGPAGQLLVKMIEAMGLRQEEVYITYVVKCRPPMNRSPEVDEIHECSSFLKEQISSVNPKVIVALGPFAAQTLLRTDQRMTQIRGKLHDFDKRKLIATFHPSYLLKNPSEKKAAWEDLKLAMQELGLHGKNQAQGPAGKN